jgi:hypothetical protein
MLDVPPGNHGAEFYAVENLDRLADVCASDDWSALRAGVLSVSHAIFPYCVHSLDVLLLPEAISSVTGSPEFQFPDDVVTVVGVEGMWGACLTPPGLVAALASIPPDSASDLRQAWMNIHIREYESESDLALVIPDWTSPLMENATLDLLSLARLAIDRDLPVVDIWAL